MFLFICCFNYHYIIIPRIACYGLSILLMVTYQNFLFQFDWVFILHCLMEFWIVCIVNVLCFPLSSYNTWKNRNVLTEKYLKWLNFLLNCLQCTGTEPRKLQSHYLCCFLVHLVLSIWLFFNFLTVPVHLVSEFDQSTSGTCDFWDEMPFRGKKKDGIELHLFLRENG